MCNLSKGVEEKGRKKGIEQGKKQGVLVSIINLMKNMHLSEMETMNVLEIPKEEQAEYIEILKNYS